MNSCLSNREKDTLYIMERANTRRQTSHLAVKWVSRATASCMQIPAPAECTQHDRTAFRAFWENLRANIVVIWFRKWEKCNCSELRAFVPCAFWEQQSLTNWERRGRTGSWLTVQSSGSMGRNTVEWKIVPTDNPCRANYSFDPHSVSASPLTRARPQQRCGRTIKQTGFLEGDWDQQTKPAVTISSPLSRTLNPMVAQIILPKKC